MCVHGLRVCILLQIVRGERGNVTLFNCTVPSSCITNPTWDVTLHCVHHSSTGDILYICVINIQDHLVKKKVFIRLLRILVFACTKHLSRGICRMFTLHALNSADCESPHSYYF